MKYLFIVSVVFLVFSFGCFNIKQDEVNITLNIKFKDGESCKLYLASLFKVTLFDSNQKKTVVKTFECTDTTDSLSLSVQEGRYSFNVVLKDSKDNKKSYASGTVDASKGDVEIDISMEDYTGGITFSWKSSDCSKYGITVIKFTLLNKGKKVTTNIWGKEVELSEFGISCEAESLELMNTPSGKYSADINSFRTRTSTVSRIIYTVPEFKTLTGAETYVDINKYSKVNVSDLTVNWNFDSRSFTSCSQANITKIEALLVFSDKPIKTVEEDCDSDKFTPLKFYDILKGSYDLILKGKNSLGTVLFEGSSKLDIKVGNIADEALAETIFIKEKINQEKK